MLNLSSCTSDTHLRVSKSLHSHVSVAFCLVPTHDTSVRDPPSMRAGNNFLQERGSNAEILEFVRQKGVSFPVMGKLDCWHHPLFQYMAEKQPDSGFISSISGPGVKWNFNKYLCDGSGVPVKRFSPSTAPLDMEADILSLLQNDAPTSTSSSLEL